MFKAIVFIVGLISLIGCSSTHKVAEGNSTKTDRMVANEVRVLGIGEVLYLQDCSKISCSSKINPRPIFPDEHIRSLLEGDTLLLPDGSQVKCSSQGPLNPPPVFPPERCQ